MILAIAVSLALVGSFLLGRHHGVGPAFEKTAEGDAFLRGQELERGRSAWIEAAHLRSYLAFFDSDRVSGLPDRIEDNLWYSIPDLYQFTSNADASTEDREAAKRVLRRLVLYFYEHPREHVQPEDINLSDELAEAAEEKKLGADPDSTEQKVFAELAEGVGNALSEFDEAIEDGLVMLSETDREIQEILDRLIQQREFPGRERSWNGMTIYLPRLSGRSGGGSDDRSFDHRGENFDLVVTHDRITLNGKDYGEVQDGSIIDLRIPRRVYVDGELRSPETNDAQQDGADQPATRCVC